MPEIYHCQRDEGWLAARLGKITASVAGDCLGIGSKWETQKDGSRKWVHKPSDSRASAWRKITGNQTAAEKKHALEDYSLRYGTNFEPVARSCYEAETGNLVTETGLWVHPELPWLAASPDGLIGDDGGLECKCLAHQVPSVPLHHRLQCLIGLACTGRQWWDYYNWPKPPLKPQLWRIHRSGIPGLIVRLDRFRREYIETGKCPKRKGAKP